jgi:cell division protein ZapA (FtsZ GTPase activity inhibitor)
MDEDKELRVDLGSKEEILQSLNFSRQKSEKDVREMITQKEICDEIRNMVFNTINCSHQQVEAQCKIIKELKEENRRLKSKLTTIKQEFKKELQKGQGDERALYRQIGEQQKVTIF